MLPGSTPLEAMRHLDEHGDAVEGVEEVREWLQQMMDTAITDLDGTHFDIADPIRTVEAMIAPPGLGRRAVLLAPVGRLLPAGPHLAADPRAASGSPSGTW